MTSAPANHLLGQTSPYLTAHAHDPVDWHPWGEEAFARARELSRPILLSIGYQSCHWCHVMQRESFRDAETATFLNAHFVAIKVDRELRPDVDHLYMTYVSMATGGGGWPMTVILTPELVPIFGGTYFPKKAPAGALSFMHVLESIDDVWSTRFDEVQEAVAEAREVLEDVMSPRETSDTVAEALAEAPLRIIALDDLANGGLAGSPKFPTLAVVDFLLAHAERSGDERALSMAERWLLAMVRGGIYDQAGGGLFRYATDERWLVPHFEKMLYDSAMLLSSLARLQRLRPSAELAFVARQTAEFLRRDLAVPGSAGYHSSLDAETDGIEGATYTWKLAELTATLSAEELALAREHLGVTDSGNWHGQTILTRRAGRDSDAEAVDGVLASLLAARSQRPQPAVITNVLVEWNALATRGLIEAGSVFGDDSLTAQGLATLDWLVAEAVVGDRVAHAIGDASVDGLELLADTAALTAALASAIELAGRDDLRPLAERLLDAALDRFAGPDGVLYETLADTELPVRPINWDDVPIPSGASTTAENLARLRPDERKSRERIVGALAWAMAQMPTMAGGALHAALG